jgi:hypothetical protein
MNAPPEKSEARRQTGRRGERLDNGDYALGRELQLLAICARTWLDVRGTLGDIAVLVHQEVDLLRRIISEKRVP